MKRYIEHIKNTRTTHERRTHAVQIAGLTTAALLVVWLGTLGLRYASPAVAQDDGSTASNQTSLEASAAAAQVQNGPHLEVSTTSIYSQ